MKLGGGGLRTKTVIGRATCVLDVSWALYRQRQIGKSQEITFVELECDGA